MTQKDWLNRATTFDMGKCPVYHRPVSIERRRQLDGEAKWVLIMDSWVLGKDGNFHFEPRPSERSFDFIEKTRFTSPEECLSFWKKAMEPGKPLNVFIE